MRCLNVVVIKAFVRFKVKAGNSCNFSNGFVYLFVNYLFVCLGTFYK